MKDTQDNETCIKVENRWDYRLGMVSSEWFEHQACDRTIILQLSCSHASPENFFGLGLK